MKMEWRITMVDEKTGKKDEREVVSEDSDMAIRHKKLRILCMLNFFNIVIAIAAAVTCFCGSKLESGCAWLVAALAWSNVYDARVFSYRLHDVADESRSIASRCLDLVSRICAGMAVAVVKSGEATEENGGEDGSAGKH
jgi:hypothetical protein